MAGKLHRLDLKKIAEQNARRCKTLLNSPESPEDTLYEILKIVLANSHILTILADGHIQIIKEEGDG